MPVTLDEVTATVEPPRPAAGSRGPERDAAADSQRTLEQVSEQLRRQARLDARARAD